MNQFENSPSPVYAVPDQNLIPVDHYLSAMAAIPPSRMFLINKGLRKFRDSHPGLEAYDASQGDGGASLTGVPRSILERAAQIQIDQGTAYDMPYGTETYRRTVIENYWRLDPGIGLGPGNVAATVGGRDALLKAYSAMLNLGYGRQGDALIVSRVPWISYNWGPYSAGINVLYSPGDPEDGWAYSDDSLRECVRFAEKSGRHVAGVLITSPDNPTGRTLTAHQQAALAIAALEAGAAFVLFDWMYHYVTDEHPMDLNEFLRMFNPEQRQRLMFLDGITKSLGGSNIRNCHLIASEDVIKFVVSRASHGVIPSFYSLAVAIAAYEMGYAEAVRPIVEPTNASRRLLQDFLKKQGFKYILGQGYYAFIHVGEWLKYRGWPDSEPMGQYLAEEHGVAIVPGVYFSVYGSEWLRFSYATPPERTIGAVNRLVQGLEALR